MNTLSFNEIFIDSTRYGTKLPSSEYLEIGKNIIVDQGKEEIAGYTDLNDGIYTDVPAIIFGDHTRIIKYIDKPFFLGADGTKILKSKLNNPNYKYLYYALKNAYIPDTGYNRHFKWLKEVNIRIVDEKEQNRIASELDKINDIIIKQNSKMKLLDELVKARFVEMFENEMNGERHKLSEFTDVITKGTTPTTIGFSFIDEGINFVKIECITDDYKFIKDKMLHISEECNNKLKRSILKEGDILYSIAGAIGRTAIVSDDILPANTNQALAIIRLKDNSPLEKKFLNEMLNSSMIKEQSSKKSNAVAQANVSLTDIGNFEIIVPSKDKQVRYSEFVEQIDKSKFIYQPIYLL